MSITASQVKEIRQEFAKLKPAAVTLDGNRAMTVKQAIFTLAPTLERMKKCGFDTQEIIERLHEKGIEVKAQTLTKYLTEARRQREGRKAQKRDTPRRLRDTNRAAASLLPIYPKTNCEQEATERGNTMFAYRLVAGPISRMHTTHNSIKGSRVGHGVEAHKGLVAYPIVFTYKHASSIGENQG